MALTSLANQWVESYLDALLSTGLSRENAARITDAEKAEVIANAEQQICAKYYVQQILGLDEEGIKQAWAKTARTSTNRPTSEKDARLEYLSWRVWGMRRKREAVFAEISHESTLEDESYQGDDTEDVDSIKPSSFASPLEGPKGVSTVLPPVVVGPNKPHLRLMVSNASESSLDDTTPSPEVPPLADTLFDDGELGPGGGGGQKYYIVMISLHGLVRGEAMELGKDADTGGQVKYVVELAKAMSQHPSVYRVDLLTRLIRDPEVDSSYGVEEECLIAGKGEMEGAYIVRLPCGPPEKYIHKEALWPHIREFADRGIQHTRRTVIQLAELAEAPVKLLAVHGHYADAGEAAALMAHTLGCDMLLTGHSLGRNKLDHLLKSGTMSRSEIEATYAVSRRIEGEERAVDGALMVFTSTQQEINDQWGLYDGYNASLEQAMRSRPRKGRRFPLMVVIPPGLDFSALKVDFVGVDPYVQLAAVGRPPTSNNPSSPRALGNASTPSSPGTQPTGGSSGTASPKGAPALPLHADPPIWQEIFRFLRNPRKPVILAMSRPDAKKNITSLVHAFGQCKPLRELANLVLVMGNRDVVDSMAVGSKKVLEQVLKLVDAYDLYGSVAYPKHHGQDDISDIYLLPAATRGVFVNVALQEPFGLTLIEAAAHGVPIVATKNGGPVDIIQTLKNGILVNPTDVDAVAAALLKIVTEPDVWEEYSTNGKTNINAYSWPAHCIKTLQQLEGEGARASNLKRFYSTYSGSFDSSAMQAAINEVANDVVGTPPPGTPFANNPFASSTHNTAIAASMAQDLGVGMDRFNSLPSFVAAAGSYTGQSTPGGALTPLISQGSQHAADDLALVSQLSSAVDALATPLSARSRYVVLAVDGDASCVRLAALLSNPKARAAMGLDDPATGLAVMSALSQRMSLQALRDAGVNTADLDFIIAGCGSEIWYQGTGGKTVEDVQYEEHIEFLWDRVGLKRTLLRLLANTPLLSSKGNGPDAPPTSFRLRRDVGHYQLLVELSNASANAVAKLPALIKKRLRAAGMRVNLTVRVEAGGQVALHLTPVRASRALALRFVASRHDLPMERFCVVAAGAMKGDVMEVGCSDGEEVVGGAQSVMVVGVEGCSWPFKVELGQYDAARVKPMEL